MLFQGVHDLKVGLPVELVVAWLCGEGACDQTSFKIYTGVAEMHHAHACKDLRLSGHSHWVARLLSICGVLRSFGRARQRQLLSRVSRNSLQ